MYYELVKISRRLEIKNDEFVCCLSNEFQICKSFDDDDEMCYLLCFVYVFQIMSKYNEDHAHEVLEWIRDVTNSQFSTSGDMDNFYEILKDGTVLCQ